MTDLVNHPAHYQTPSGIEAIDVIEGFGFSASMHLGNALKYLLRAGRKGDAATDLRKAEWYVRRWHDGRLWSDIEWPERESDDLTADAVALAFDLHGHRRLAVLALLDLADTCALSARRGAAIADVVRRIHLAAEEAGAAAAAVRRPAAGEVVS